MNTLNSGGGGVSHRQKRRDLEADLIRNKRGEEWWKGIGRGDIEGQEKEREGAGLRNGEEEKKEGGSWGEGS